MPPRCPGPSQLPLAPFLYPALFRPRCSNSALLRTALSRPTRHSSSSSSSPSSNFNSLPESRLNPAPDDYASPSFADKAELTLYAGRGGNGCISFQREAYFPDGPPNGGDGGIGGNVYIQAAHGETSLHKLARRRFVRAGRGIHGQGSGKGGMRGADVIITVPVGTVVQEIERHDPAADEEIAMRAWQALKKQRRRELLAQQQLEPEPEPEAQEDDDVDERRSRWNNPEDDYDPDADDPEREKWLLYPGLSKNDVKTAEFPKLPKRTRFFQQPAAPVYLDLSRPTPTPILLAVGGIGGLGNPHFSSRQHPRPVFATKGDEAVTLKISLELKLLADVGLVGLPNAGKSTLLRALTNSRTRVGNWAFTTLQPNIGTVVLDRYSGRPSIKAGRYRYPSPGASNTVKADDDGALGEPRTRFTVADIPGLVEGAHLDRGLGIAFLRHVERAGLLAFVIDLSAGNAVKALQALWREVGLYAEMRQDEERSREIESRVDWDLVSQAARGPVNLMGASYGTPLPMQEAQTKTPTLHIAGKPWFVVATKADLPETQENFRELKTYLDAVTEGREQHPSGVEGAWTDKVAAIPVSAIQGQGVDRIIHWAVGLLDA